MPEFFKNGHKRGSFVCKVRYAGNDHWEFVDLSVAWPIQDHGNPIKPPRGHKQHQEVFFKDGKPQS